MCDKYTSVFVFIAASILSRLEHDADFFGKASDFVQWNGSLFEEPLTTTEVELWTETSTESSTLEQTTELVSSSSMAPTTEASTTKDDIFTTLSSIDGSTTPFCKSDKKF